MNMLNASLSFSNPEETRISLSRNHRGVDSNLNLNLNLALEKRVERSRVGWLLVGWWVGWMMIIIFYFMTVFNQYFTLFNLKSLLKLGLERGVSAYKKWQGTDSLNNLDTSNSASFDSAYLHSGMIHLYALRIMWLRLTIFFMLFLSSYPILRRGKYGVEWMLMNLINI